MLTYYVKADGGELDERTTFSIKVAKNNHYKPDTDYTLRTWSVPRADAVAELAATRVEVDGLNRSMQ